jgi:Ca2+-binding RTX toxin-like protein
MTITVTGTFDMEKWIRDAKVGRDLNREDYTSHADYQDFNFITKQITLDDNTAFARNDTIKFTEGYFLGTGIASVASVADDYIAGGLYLQVNTAGRITAFNQAPFIYKEYDDGGVLTGAPPRSDSDLYDLGSDSSGDIYGARIQSVGLVKGLDWDMLDFARAAEAVRAGNYGKLIALMSSESYNVTGESSDDVIVTYNNNDRVDGLDGNDYIVTRGGDDTIIGGRGSDRIFAGDGNDNIWANEGDNTISAGNGNDTFNSFDNGTNTVNGGAGDDRYILGDGADILTDDDGYDTIQFTNAANANWVAEDWTGDLANDFWDPTQFERYELTGADDTVGMRNDFKKDFSIVGGNGIDTITGGGGNDLIWGDAGNDILQGQSGADAMNGGSGNDAFDGGSGNDRLRGGTGNDSLNGGSGSDIAEFDDHFGNASGGWNIDLIADTANTSSEIRVRLLSFLVQETDTLTNIESVVASKGNDIIQSAEGRIVSNVFTLLGGSPLIDGHDGIDRLKLAPSITSASLVLGQVADDVVTFTADNAALVTTATTVKVGSGLLTRITEGEGQLNFKNIEILDTGVGNDVVVGSTAADVVLLGAGDDRVTGGFGADRLDGGEGADRFTYSATNHGTDTIVNFGATDVFAFKGTAFANLAKGALKSANFWSNTTGKAHDTSDRFIFDTTDDTLWFDSNGSASGGEIVKIADLTNDFNLRASDILIV